MLISEEYKHFQSVMEWEGDRSEFGDMLCITNKELSEALFVSGRVITCYTLSYHLGDTVIPEAKEKCQPAFRDNP